MLTIHISLKPYVVTEEVALQRGYTHITTVYRQCEFDLLDKAIKNLDTEEFLLVVSKRPPGLSIWRPLGKVALG